ncbi:MAG: hypothetical protein PHO75_03155 [Candidatus Shapirobacteria bacterium]|jgi:hypothetical protein|nr:hypothetical protein [Candidatus Shapirobacteria bacterium]
MKTATKNIIKTSTLLLLLATGYSLLLNSVKAQSVISVTAIPPRLEVTVKADGVITKTIKVRNESNSEKIINTKTSDFIVNDNNGTPIKVETNSEDNRWAASSWVQVSPTSLKLKPGETKSLTVTVVPPKNALPGGHYVMILHTPENISSLSSTGASVQTEVGTLLYITVPGNIKENAVIKDFTAPKFSEFGPIDFNSIIQNLSDIHIKPAGNIAITNMFGLKTTNIQFNKDGINIFPGKIREIQSQLSRKWLFGRYKAELNAVYGTTGAVATAAIIFWVLPWRFLILVGTGLIIIAIIILILKKKTGNKENGQEKVDELEQELEALKKKYKDQ